MVIQALWHECLRSIEQEVGSRLVETWLKVLSCVRWDALLGTIYLEAPNQFVHEWVLTHYKPLLEQHLRRVLNVPFVALAVSVASTQTLEHKNSASISSKKQTEILTKSESIAVIESATKPQTPALSISAKSYDFDGFVVGPDNHLAYAAAHAVTEKPGCLYNPLFIFGGAGLGKTHLLHAIGAKIAQQKQGMNVVYQTADRFVQEFVQAVRTDKAEQFERKYHRADVLLIDDLQFIEKKERSQQAFSHIFNNLYEARKQVVFSSDVSPEALEGFAERVKSRLEAGFVAQLTMPSLETRLSILRRKAEIHNVALSSELLLFLASRPIKSIRELEGCLIRVMAFASLTQQHITMETAQKALGVEAQVQGRKITTERIMNVLEQNYPYRLSELRSYNRSKNISLARHVGMYLIRKLTNISLYEVGIYFGRKDHSTVHHAIARIESMLELDAEFARHIKKIEHEITSC